MKTNQKDSEKMITPIVVQTTPSRPVPKLLFYLMLFVCVTYVVYTLRLISSSSSRAACDDDFFTTRRHRTTADSLIRYVSTADNQTGRIFRRESREKIESTEIKHLVFGIAASSSLWSQRKNYIKLWYRKKSMRGVVWMDGAVESDGDDEKSLPPVRISGDTSNFPYTNKQGHRSAIRISRIVSETLRLGLKNVRWFVMGDDDTVFVTDNLVRILRKYDHNQMYYIGGQSESHLQNIFFSYGMAYGGGGFAISFPLAKALAKMQDRCIHRYPGLYGSDDRMQACMAELGVPLTKEVGFHQTAEIERRIEQETKAEKHIQKLLLLGAGESGKSTIFKQIKLLFQTGFDEAELKGYISVIHANVYQTIKLLHDGSKELAQSDTDSAKYVLSNENKENGERLSEIGGRLEYPRLTKELAQDIETLWKDPAIQETYARGNELQVPDCTNYFMENLQRLSDSNYVPTKEDVLYARVRTTGVVEIQFSPVGENKKSGEVYRLFDVGGQRNERRKWIHLFEGVTAVIFCAAISEYDQTLFEDDNKNRMMETKELFDWVLKQPCFEKTSFMLFLNKFDIFEKKVLKVPLNACEWFKDYQPVSTGKQEIEHAYEFVKKKFEELYFQSTAPDRVDRVFKIYRTTALDQKLVKKTFKLVDETLRRRNLFEAGLL